MPEYNSSSLHIDGYFNLAVPNTFLRLKQDSNKLAVMFPGLGYTCHMPLLYYATEILLGYEYDVLQLNTDYTRRDYQFSSREERASWILTDSQAAVHCGLAQREYTSLILIGKSIGTMAMAGIININVDLTIATIWLTPLLNQPYLVNAALCFKGPALFIGGTGDQTYLLDVLNRIEEKNNARILIVDGADHSLEIKDDIPRSLNILDKSLHTIIQFLNDL
jgi:predicted alpha/beta-hydrolase family hydrolase